MRATVLYGWWSDFLGGIVWLQDLLCLSYHSDLFPVTVLLKATAELQLMLPQFFDWTWQVCLLASKMFARWYQIEP